MLTLFQVGLMIAANDALCVEFWGKPFPFNYKAIRTKNLSNTKLQMAILDGEWLSDTTLTPPWDH